jgi:glutamate carboxypeptidase
MDNYQIVCNESFSGHQKKELRKTYLYYWAFRYGLLNQMPANNWTIKWLNSYRARCYWYERGDVVVIAALQALKKFRLIRQRINNSLFYRMMKRAGLPISVSRKDFITRAQQCDVALGFETHWTRQQGSSWAAETNVTAKTGHSGCF